MPVHFAGLPCDMDALQGICQSHNLTLIDDAAHAIPTEYKEQYIGNIGDLSAFSFYANKKPHDRRRGYDYHQQRRIR